MAIFQPDIEVSSTIISILFSVSNYNLFVGKISKTNTSPQQTVCDFVD